ncbi:MAG TPA: DUF1801 domain-containing protein [Anaerolineaceae bacterium]|jgi:uncharacterized protein YdhG (YjbR/CyaY superfamily)|nr:DUF1801 domain-containing protein [Anaerolineaceae bacterium]HPS32570.1 DUF1801 domain-containing protein [Anaerolineaceae bacterium]
MQNAQDAPKTIPEYIAALPAEKQAVLNIVLEAVRAAAPGAQEKLSYGMPAFFLDGILVYVGMQKRHVGFYPTPEAVAFFAGELRGFKTSKGAVQFPLDQPVPVELVKKIVRHRIEVNRAAIAAA